MRARRRIQRGGGGAATGAAASGACIGLSAGMSSVLRVRPDADAEACKSTCGFGTYPCARADGSSAPDDRPIEPGGCEGGAAGVPVRTGGPPYAGIAGDALDGAGVAGAETGGYAACDECGDSPGMPPGNAACIIGLLLRGSGA